VCSDRRAPPAGRRLAADDYEAQGDGLRVSGGAGAVVRRYWLYQVSEKVPLLIADGAALTVLPETIVIG